MLYDLYRDNLGISPLSRDYNDIVVTRNYDIRPDFRERNSASLPASNRSLKRGRVARASRALKVHKYGPHAAYKNSGNAISATE